MSRVGDPTDLRAATARTRPRVAPIVAAAAGFYLLFVAARLATFGWDPSAFIVAGDQITDVSEAPDSIGVHRGVDGYDGQAYYRLSRAPLTDEVRDHGIAFERPAYWQARIGYPATVWVLSLGGREALVPAVMVAVNVLAMVAVAALAAVLARDRGRSRWLGLIPVLWAGYVVGVAEDLTEPLAGAFLLAALLALRRERWAWGAAALTAAVLTRETSLIVAGAVLAVALVPLLLRLSRSAEPAPTPPWWTGAVPIGVYLGWRAWVRERWSDAVPDPPSDNPLGVPFVELARYLVRAAGDPAGHADNLVLLLPTLAVLALLALALTSRDAGLAHERLALAAYLVLLACLPVWDRGEAYLRWCCEPLLLGWVVLLARPAVRLRALGAAVAALWLVAALATYRYPGTDTWVAAGDTDDRHPTSTHDANTVNEG